MKLVFDGPDRQYHPATGLDLIPGEADYPDEQAEALKAAGLREPKAAAPKRPKASEEKE